MVYVGDVHDIHHSVRKRGGHVVRVNVNDETILTLSDRNVLFCFFGVRRKKSSASVLLLLGFNDGQ